jgi:hypothetical protein
MPAMGANDRETLTRWEEHGAIWRTVHLSDSKVIVDLCTCSGEPVDRIESGDPELIDFVRQSADRA